MPIVKFKFPGITKVGIPNTDRAIIIDGEYTTQDEAEIEHLKSLLFEFEVIEAAAKARHVPEPKPGDANVTEEENKSKSKKKSSKSKKRGR